MGIQFLMCLALFVCFFLMNYRNSKGFEGGISFGGMIGSLGCMYFIMINFEA